MPLFKGGERREVTFFVMLCHSWMDDGLHYWNVLSYENVLNYQGHLQDKEIPMHKHGSYCLY